MSKLHAELVIATYNAPPYQFIDENEIKGETVSTVQCIFHILEKESFIDFYPLKRALHELDKNSIDGLFPVHSYEDNIQNHTSPISIEKWFWLTNFPIGEKKNLATINSKLVASVNGSPAHEWLVANNYEVDITVTTRTQLLQMFEAKRVDAIIIDDSEAYRDLEFHHLIEQMEHYWRFIKFEPHHFAFSEKAIADNPFILEEFNKNISNCSPISLNISGSEKQALKKYLTPYLLQISDYLKDKSHLTQLRKKFPKLSIEEIDTRWQREVKTQQGGLYNFVHNEKLSHFLAKLHTSSNGKITEIIAIDNEGFSIALSQNTTDLYQGDEAQFLNTFPSGAASVHVSNITYDESTQTFQSQVSFALPKNNAPVSVITFGVNVEKVILNTLSK